MKSNLITREGWDSLKEELRYLWKEERPKVTQVVHEAAKNGDRSENGDYIYGKRRLREIDRRVRYLSKRVEDAEIVDYSPEQEGKVFFGAYVTVEDDHGEENCYRIVGSDELDPKKGYISIDSPMARALIGKVLDDELQVITPSGPQNYCVCEIRYDRIAKPV